MLDAKTRGWVVVETADLRVRSDARPSRAVELAADYQRMHDAIAEHELPCGFDRLTAPVEVTLFQQTGDMSLHRQPANKPSWPAGADRHSHLGSKRIAGFVLS